MGTRVFELAKELGVKSKEIIERCKSEGIPGIDNHMTTVSIGLTESIRGWFQADESGSNGEASAAPTAKRAAGARGARARTSDRSDAKGVAKKATARRKAVRKTKSDDESKSAIDARRAAARARAAAKSVARRPAARKKTDQEPTRDRGDRSDQSTTVEQPRTRPGTAAGRRRTEMGKTDESADSTATTSATGTEATPSAEASPTATTIGEPVEGPVETEHRDDASGSDLTEAPDSSLAAAADGSGLAPEAGIDERVDESEASTPTGGAGAVPGDEPEAPASQPNVPSRPEVVGPAGPMLESKTPAKLSGPRVVRIEEAEPVRAPSPRARSGGGGGHQMGGRGATGFESPDGGGREGAGISRRNVRRKNRSGRQGRSGYSGRFADGGGGGGGGAGARPRDWNQQDLIEREERLRGSHGFIKTLRRESNRREQATERAKTARETGGVVKIQQPFTIKDLSAATGVKATEILMALMQKGMMTTVNSGIDTDLAQEIMIDYDIELEVEAKKTAEDVVAEKFQQRETVDERSRYPVVTILGHVDHGKTSLLDKIRHAHVAEGEAGGITQHTSAFRVKIDAETGEEEKQIVFLDTPGHEAFTAMRARGAQCTDIVVLVVAADDGVMPQTEESIAHARAAEVPIIIALNKIDKPEATEGNLQRIYGQLAEHELAPSDWGGTTDVVKCSAITGEGISDLLETIDLQAQVMELKADFGGPARGTVLEAEMVDGRGAVANVLVREGEMKVGDFVAVGRAFGRVRDITNDRGERIESAGPSTPVAISGIDRLPDAGDTLYIVDSLKMAQDSAEQRLAFEREQSLAAPKITLDNIFTTISERERHDFNLIVKADTQGSIETLKKSLEDISTDEINIRILHSAVGGIAESDVLLAEASEAIILGFHVIASSKARVLAEQKNIEIRPYQVIYELLDDVRKAASGLLEPERREEVLGHAEVREVFKISKVGMIAGCYVTDGTVQRNAKIRVTRQDIVIEDNRVLEQLKRFKEDAKEVRAGQECGMKIEGYDDIKEGDVLECFKVVEIARTI